MTKKNRSKRTGSAARVTVTSINEEDQRTATNDKNNVSVNVNVIANGTSSGTNCKEISSNSKSIPCSKSKAGEVVAPEIPPIILPPVSFPNGSRAELELGNGQVNTKDKIQVNDKGVFSSPASSLSLSLSSSTNCAVEHEPSTTIHHSTRMTNTNKEELRNKLFKNTKSKPKVSLHNNSNSDLGKIKSDCEQDRDLNSGRERCYDTSKNSKSKSKFHQPENPPPDIFQDEGQGNDEDPDENDEETTRLLDSTNKSYNKKNYHSFPFEPFKLAPHRPIVGNSILNSTFNLGINSKSGIISISDKSRSNKSVTNSGVRKDSANDNSNSKSDTNGHRLHNNDHDNDNDNVHDHDHDPRTKTKKTKSKSKSGRGSGSDSDQILQDKTEPNDSFNFHLFEKSLDDEIKSRENPTQVFPTEIEMEMIQPRRKKVHGSKNEVPKSDWKEGQGPGQGIEIANRPKLTSTTSSDFCIDMSSLDESDPEPDPIHVGHVKHSHYCQEYDLLARTRTKTRIPLLPSPLTSGMEHHGNQNQNSKRSSLCQSGSESFTKVPQTTTPIPDVELDRKKLLSALSSFSRSTSASTNSIINTVKNLVSTTASSSFSSGNSSSEVGSLGFGDRKRYARKLDLEGIKKAACDYAIANNPNSKIRTRAMNPAVTLAQVQVPANSAMSSSSSSSSSPFKVKCKSKGGDSEMKVIKSMGVDKQRQKDSHQYKDKGHGQDKDSEVEEILGLDLEHENPTSYLNLDQLSLSNNSFKLSSQSQSGQNQNQIQNQNQNQNHSHHNQSFQLYSVPENFHFPLGPDLPVSSGHMAKAFSCSDDYGGTGSDSGSSSSFGGADILGCLLGSTSTSASSDTASVLASASVSALASGAASASAVTASAASTSRSTSSCCSPGSSGSGSSSGPGGLAACCSILDGINNLCEVQTCSKPASKKCANCKSAYYCGEEHQRCDWRKHKNHCIPYKMEVKGSDDVSSVSVMVAVRNIPAGKLIFAEKPTLLFPVASFDTDFVHVMDLNCVVSPDFLHTCGAKSPACLGCMKCVEFIGAKRHECSKCGLPLCSQQCEYAMYHQIGECQVISSCGDLRKERKPPSCFHSLYLDVEILRALQLEALYPSEWEKFLELRNHVRVELYKKSERYGRFVGNVKRLVPYSAKASGYNFDLIHDVHAIITALSFKPSLKSPYKMLIGTQLYFDHSCVPNTIHYVEHQVTGHVNKMRCVVKAAMPIMKGDVISVDFVPTPYLAYLLRRRVLENLCLNCSCRRCVQPSEIGDHGGDITCPNCRRGLVTPERPLEWKESIWSCRACQEEVPYSQVAQIYQDWRNQLYCIPKTRDSLDKLYQFIQKAQRHLNPTHELVVMAWCFIETAIRPNLEAHRTPDSYKVLPHTVIQDYKLLKQYCDVCEKHFDALRPGLWLDRGVVLFQKFYSNFALTCKDMQDNRLQRKAFVHEVLRSMKCLQDSLAILQTYEGYNATDSVNRLTQDAIWTLATVKTFIAKYMQDNVEALSVKSRSVDI